MLPINTFLIIVLAAAAFGQTQVDLRTQAKAVNFTAATATLPLKTGTTLPASCQPAELFFKTNAPAGSNIFGCTGNNSWTVQSGAGSTVGQLANLAVTRTGPTVLTVGSGCVLGSPCNVRFGNTVYSIQNSATATVTAGSGLAFIYISSAGMLTVGHGFNVTCSVDCLAQAGVSGFPADSIPLFTWSATSGTWDAAGGVDFRALLSSKNILAGTGLISTETTGLTTVSIDPTLISVRTAAPATAASACIPGNWAFDSTFFYVCVATNSWKRAGVVAW